MPGLISQRPVGPAQPDELRPEPAPPSAPQTATVAGHEITVFVESPPLFDAILKDILAAKKRIWIEVYIFYNDESCKRLADALQQKAKEGLDVRVLYDAVGSNTTPSAFFNQMAAAGVKVHAFHSFWEGLRRFRPFTILNRRDHRKLIVIDDAIGYFGGMNLVENVHDVAQEKAENRPTSSGWRDVHLRLVGPQQADLAESYDRSWRRAHGETISRRPRAYRRALYAAASHNGSDESIRFFDSGPGGRFSRAGRVFSRLIRRARHTVTLSMAYFIPVGAVVRALLSARRRGVRIRVVVPGKSDVKLVQRATCYLYDKLLNRGFRIYERRQRMLHSKAMVVDDLYCVVGSCNLDPRSLYINLEFLAVIRSATLAKILSGICSFEARQSDRVTLRSCTRFGRWQRFLNRAAWTLRWFL